MTTETTTKRSLLATLRSNFITLILIAAALGAGWYLREGLAPVAAPPDESSEDSQTAESAPETIWTCAMHPQIQMSEPGACPLCGMDLIPLETSAHDGSPGADRRIGLSKEAQTLARIQTHPVERRFVEAEVRMVGKIQVDETRLAYLTAWAPGRLDRLYVDYTGVEVNAGDHMVNLYSPKIYTDQSALLSAIAAKRDFKRNTPSIDDESIDATIDAARERLRQMGLNASQVEEIEERGTASDHITINAPIGGVVIDKNAQQGMYVKEGTRIYTIADLTHLWVQLDAYESDLAWLHYGQHVEFQTEAYPGEIFHGTIAFLARELDPVTQTIKVRVNLANESGQLKPGMFVRAVVHTKVSANGRVMDSELSGKWICSMHPEIVRDEPGSCDVCGMDLVTTESLGYVPFELAEQERPLVIPATAALRTGRRAVVYVEVEDQDVPTYEGREILLGARTGDWYIVKAGLEEGERVVTNGAFKLDSALQIMAKPSMMSASTENVEEPNRVVHHHSTELGKAPAKSDPLPMPDMDSMPGMDHEKPTEEFSAELPPDFKASLESLREAYLAQHSALYRDSFADSKQAAQDGLAALEQAQVEALNDQKLKLWEQRASELRTLFSALSQSADIATARQHFEGLSLSIGRLLLDFGQTEGLRQAKCPMALSRGALWLQLSDSIENPYFDGKMKSCGSILGKLTEMEPGDE